MHYVSGSGRSLTDEERGKSRQAGLSDSLVEVDGELYAARVIGQTLDGSNIQDVMQVNTIMHLLRDLRENLDDRLASYRDHAEQETGKRPTGDWQALVRGGSFGFVADQISFRSGICIGACKTRREANRRSIASQPAHAVLRQECRGERRRDRRLCALAPSCPCSCGDEPRAPGGDSERVLARTQDQNYTGCARQPRPSTGSLGSPPAGTTALMIAFILRRLRVPRVASATKRNLATTRC